MYTIGQVSEMFDIPVSTLRYYDREGLFPGLERSSGIRYFAERELEALRVIDCLKKTGLDIKSIRRFMEWCAEGSSTYSQRLELFCSQLVLLDEEMERLNRTRCMVMFKCWYYEKALKDGNEDGINALLPDKLPEEIQRLYDQSHIS